MDVRVLRQHTLHTIYPVGPVHCYSGELEGEQVLFDTGPPGRDAQECLRREVDLSRLRHVFVTHCHVDHYGLASWLEQHTNAVLYLPYKDKLKIEGYAERLAKLGELLCQAGFDLSFVASLRRGMDDGKIFPQFPERFKTVEGDLPQRLGLEVLGCPGHSQSDLVFVGRDWAVTGDVLLRGIFQVPLLDVDLEDGRRFDNYRAYCQSLGRLATLRGRQVLPGHRQAIESVDETILAYVGKLLERAAQLTAFSPRDSLSRVVDQVFGGVRREPFFYYMKASEVAFMRDFLDDPGSLRTALEGIGLFEPVAAKFQQTVCGRAVAVVRT